MHDRRAVLVLLAGGCLPAPTRAQTQRLMRIGFVSWFSPAESADLDMLRAGLRDYGYVDGQTVRIEAVFADGDRKRAEDALRGMVEARTDVIVVRATAAAHAAKRVVATTPVVMLVSDPLATGLVTSLSRPGGTMTGLSLLGPDLAGKRLGYLKALKPTIASVAFLGDTTDPNAATFAEQTHRAGKALGIAVEQVLIEGASALTDALFDRVAGTGAEAVIVQPIFGGHQERILALAGRRRLAVVSNYRIFADAGAVFSYGPDDRASTRRAAYFVDRILKGTPPGELPIEQPTEFRLVLNARAARSLGLTIPATLAAEADEVID